MNLPTSIEFHPSVSDDAGERTRGLRLDPYVFVPERWILLNKFLHKPDAFFRLENLDRDAARP